MRILITGAQIANKGAQSMLFTVMDQFRRHYGDVEVYYSPLDGYLKYASGQYRFNLVYKLPPTETCARLPEPARKLAAGVKVAEFRLLKRNLLPPPPATICSIYSAMKDIDALVDVSGYCLSSGGTFAGNMRLLRQIELAKRLGKKVILLPQSFGPFDFTDRKKEMDEIIPRVLSRVDLLYAREADGKRLLEEKYGLANVRLAPDIVLQTGEVDWRNILFDPLKLRVPQLPGPHNVAVIPSVMTMTRADGDFLSCYVQMIEALLRAGKQVYIFRHSGDLDFCRIVYAPFEGRDGVTLIEHEFSCWEYSKFIEQFEFIVTSRFHSIVHAYKRGVPALILGWAIKYRELAARFGQTDYVFDDAKDYQCDAILAALRQLTGSWREESERIRSALAELQRQSCFEECWKLLDPLCPPKAQAEPAETPPPAARHSIREISERGLCSACGICAANCPANCITLVREGYEVKPHVNEAACVGCGRCQKVCSAGQLDAYEPGTDLNRYLLGEHRGILCVQAKDREIMADSTSGGLVTQLVRALLDGGEYQSAFLVDGYDYTKPLAVRRFTAKDDLSATPGSRYLTVSQEAAARYMIAHPDERIILVATPCAVQSLRNTIELNRLDRERFLLIGLFCDKTMHYGVVEYFSKHPKSRGRALRGMRFRTKRIAGWPGDLRLEYADGSCEDLPSAERMQVKEYFMPERCLYCLDKLNRGCDIAVGDNYLKENKDPLGVNSCILRTERGEVAWNQYRELFHWHEDSAEELILAQRLVDKRQNYYNACMKHLYSSDSCLSAKRIRAYRGLLSRIEVGRAKNCRSAIRWDMRRRAATQKLRRTLKKLKNIKR